MKRSSGFARLTWIGMLSILISDTAHGAVVINEIHYSPDVKTELVEFVELYNNGANSIDLTGWRFSSGINLALPSGTRLDPAQYLVVAQNTNAIRAKFGVAALGPFIGGLSKQDKLVLRNAAGEVEDEVEYKLGFPWPTVGDAPGYSIELINPDADNSLGGSWRASVAGNPGAPSQTLIPEKQIWNYFKGTSEASTPATAWRLPDFDDSGWLSGTAPIGYGETFLGTVLGDMQGAYTGVFLRKQFVVADPAQVASLLLDAAYDDGFKVWINGVNVWNANISTGELAYNGTAGTSRESGNYEPFTLNSPAAYLVAGTNTIAVQAHNSSLTSGGDFFFDLRLRAQANPPPRGPTPGRINSVYAVHLPPQIRQVEHHPEQPVSGQPVTITAKITDDDGVAGATLQYQLVDPGSYIEITDAAYLTNWVSLAMNDGGVDGDVVAGDGVYAVTLPAPLQTHRRLMRYRLTAADAGGRSVTVPYADDPQPNFAYFVYDGVPGWSAAVRPGVTPVVQFKSEVMGRLPVYHLISKKASVERATWIEKYTGDLYKWTGTLVYDGKVYDHIHYRARGGVWRYAMGKNMWKFDLNRGHDFEARDDWGRKFKTGWTKVNLGASIQQGDYSHRGEQGMFESVGFKLFNLVGVESPETAFVTFRVIDDVLEANPANQFDGDFWGVYLAIEQEDSRFLEEHGLPDGNLYKMENNTGELNNLGPEGPVNKSDLNAFLTTYTGRTAPTDAWWRTNLNLEKYYSYQSIVQAMHHYDICCGKNYFYYLNPVTQLWEVHTWDLDLTWADTMYVSGVNGGTEPFQSRVLPRAAFKLEFGNRLREIRDLLWNTDQAWRLIDEYAALLRGPGNGPTILDADQAQWDYNPVMINSSIVNTGKAGQGRFYQRGTPTKDFAGMVQLMKNYVTYRSSVVLDPMALDPLIPNTPTISYAGPTGFPANRLSFRSSNFNGNGGAFAAMKWRVAEVTDLNSPIFSPAEPMKYEINADWDSGELSAFTSELTIPAQAIKVGHRYRARVQMKDDSGRWSHWSPAVEFTVAEPDQAVALLDSLRISELMYNPPAGSEFEFVELHNTSSQFTLDLNGVKFTQGIDFTFGPGSSLPPNGYLLVVRATNANSFGAFRAQYGLGPDVAIAGPYSGSLDNAGEQLTLRTSAGGTDIVSFTYSDGRGWPLSADGAGHSLVPLDSAEARQNLGSLDYGGNWHASAYLNGSPGRADPPTDRPALLNEIVSHTDFTGEFDSNDWIELYNPAATNFTLSAGWFLSDDGASLRKWRIPSGTVIPARGWVSFDEVTGFHNPTNTGFGLNKAGEQVFLSHLPGTAEDRVVDSISFKAQENDWSLGRYPDGGSEWYALIPRTRSVANAPPITHITIGEIMYHPAESSGTNDNTRDEFIELFNPTANSVDLFNTNGTWRIDGDVNFALPGNTVLPAEGFLLIVNFSPADAAALAAFRNTYGLSNTNVRIVGPYGGKLPNSSGRVAIEKPIAPDLPGESIAWVIVEEVIYADQSPWPTAPDGTGSTLTRSSLALAGRDPANWIAALPTPGRAVQLNGDSDSDGIPDAWEKSFGLSPNNPGDAGQDPDGDGRTNLEEYLSGTDPRDGRNYLKIDAVSRTGGVVTLRFTAVAGKSYSLLYRDAVGNGSWRKWTDIEASSVTRDVENTDSVPAATSARFYRLVTPKTP